MAADVARLWGFALAEATAKTRQRLDLPTNSCAGAAAKPSSRSRFLNPQTTRSLRDECLSRGVRLESVLMASLLMAAAEALRLAGQRRAPEAPFRVRLQRALVLGLVCFVMTLLSGSVDAKALRYFCSFYAVFAGMTRAELFMVDAVLPSFVAAEHSRSPTAVAICSYRMGIQASRHPRRQQPVESFRAP